MPAKQRNAVSLQSLTAFQRAVANHLVHILLPSADNTGRPFGREDFDRVKEDLASCFEGVTAYLQAPAEGQWRSDGGGDRLTGLAQTARRARTAVPAGHGDHPLHADGARIERRHHAINLNPQAEYDPQTKVLGVVRDERKRYDYEAVPPETYAAFRNAFVKGRFFNNHIRNRFWYRLIADA
ncbi:KTSC domain-containing protein [Mesorhizobium wenxiniae]|uniref:KTSC domain-containing protein n=1 Tax=Mesorhizobium wenxiniae TaxID=2014805 RepID=UPI001FD87673|nr:KTSC domain-containing protein [Mesorhizobium wenxiniae]